MSIVEVFPGNLNLFHFSHKTGRKNFLLDILVAMKNVYICTSFTGKKEEDEKNSGMYQFLR